MRLFVSTFVLAVTTVLAASAHADELVVLAAAATKQALAPVPDQLLKSTGDHVRFVFGTAGAMHDKALAGSPFDIVIVPPAPLADLIERGAVVAGSREDLGVVRLAAAVRSGTPVPDISSVDALKTALLHAASIGIADPATGATSGIYLAKLMEKIGIEDAVGPKLKRYPDGSAAMEAVARGEIALGLGQKSEITPVQGVQLIGILPEAVQLSTIYSAGLASQAANKKPAHDLLMLLESPEAQASFARNGFDPPR
jgi:molybdate transport system substrate-binding protein